MPYVVRASTQAGDSEWEFDDAVEAAKKATELLSHGVPELTVEAAGGRVFRENELTEMLAIAEVTDAGRT